MVRVINPLRRTDTHHPDIGCVPMTKVFPVRAVDHGSPAILVKSQCASTRSVRMQCSILPGSEMRQFPYEIKYSVGVSGGRPHRFDALLINSAPGGAWNSITPAGVSEIGGSGARYEAPDGAMSDGVTVLPLSVDGDRGQR